MTSYDDARDPCGCDAPGGLDKTRRSILMGSAALALGSAASAGPATAEVKPERQKMQVGDRFQIVSGPLDGQTLEPEMLTTGEAPLEAFPLDPATGVLRRGNRLNRVLALRLDPEEMDEETRARNADGVLIFSAICTHLNCTVNSWMPEERFLRCPCHLSTFAALSGGSVTGGPARKKLPMVPLALDDEGFVVAAEDFNVKPGAKSV